VTVGLFSTSTFSWPVLSVRSALRSVPSEPPTVVAKAGVAEPIVPTDGLDPPPLSHVDVEVPGGVGGDGAELGAVRAADLDRLDGRGRRASDAFGGSVSSEDTTSIGSGLDVETPVRFPEPLAKPM
jgi:hypothetical protein